MGLFFLILFGCIFFCIFFCIYLVIVFKLGFVASDFVQDWTGKESLGLMVYLLILVTGMLGLPPAVAVTLILESRP